jgi:hypothetical protein
MHPGPSCRRGSGGGHRSGGGALQAYDTDHGGEVMAASSR